MKLWMKASLTGILAISALFSATWAVRSIKAVAEDVPSVSYEWSCDEEDAQFVLREYSGFVSVFAVDASKTPMTVTDIEIKNLREADRDMLNAGIAVSDRDELLALLEDLGS